MRYWPLLLSLFIVACTDQSGGSAEVTQMSADKAASAPAMSINWYSGSVEEAFAEAERAQKPVFLYWGAQWCPPCHELKATIFKRPEFVKQSSLFVPVYLDGDSERAQLYGERFSVMGYPTVIIFSPAGEEITRIPGGMNIEQYVGVLDLALNALQPVAELVASVRAGESLQDADWRLLAYYSWTQDRGRALGDQALEDAALMLAQACPARLATEKSMLQVLALNAWLANEERDDEIAPQHMAALSALLGDEYLARANLSGLLYTGGDLVTSLAQNDSERKALHDQLEKLYISNIHDPEIHVLTRLDALYGWLEVNQAMLAEGEALSDAQQQWLYQQTETAREGLNSYQQHTAINTVWQLYLQAGLEQQARDALAMGMEISRQPYYFMSGMGSLEDKAGNEATALDWYRKAWDSSTGAATRVQWGSNYLLALVKISPDDGQAIQQTGVTILEEVAGQASGLHHRSALRMNRVSEKLLEWGADGSDEELRQRVLEVLRAEMDAICDELQEQPEICGTFLQAPQAA